MLLAIVLAMESGNWINPRTGSLTKICWRSSSLWIYSTSSFTQIIYMGRNMEKCHAMLKPSTITSPAQRKMKKKTATFPALRSSKPESCLWDQLTLRKIRAWKALALDPKDSYPLGQMMRNDSLPLGGPTKGRSNATEWGGSNFGRLTDGVAACGCPPCEVPALFLLHIWRRRGRQAGPIMQAKKACRTTALPLRPAPPDTACMHHLHSRVAHVASAVSILRG